MQQNKECLTNGEGSVISTYFNQILIKHERSEDINSITEQHSYGNKDHSKDDDKVKVELLVPRLKHENEEVDKIKCIECEYFAKTKKSLNNHIKIEHKGLTFKCKECEFQTQFKINLSRHKNIHEGTVHTCNQCKSIFRCRDSLTRHIRYKLG